MEPWPPSAGPTSSRRPSQPMQSAASSPLASSRSTAAATTCARELGDRLGQARGRLRDDEIWGGMPAVGDWVVVCDAPGDRFAIEALLPRRTKVSRKTPWLKAEEHILVANVDTVLLVSGARPGLQPAAPGAVPDSCLGQRCGSRDRADEARRLRRLRQARRGRGGRGGRAGPAGEQRHGRRDRGRSRAPASRRRRSSSSARRGRASRRS